MIQARTLRAREKLLGKLPVSGELLRSALLERTVRHSRGCPKCARGEGHRVFVLTVSYPAVTLKEPGILVVCPDPGEAPLQVAVAELHDRAAVSAIESLAARRW
jgi:hypothetical protein